MPTIDELLTRIAALEARLSGAGPIAADGLTAEQRAQRIKDAEDAKWAEVNVNDAQALHAYLADHETRIAALEAEPTARAERGKRGGAD